MNYGGKVTSANKQTFVVGADKTFFVFAPHIGHSVMKEGRKEGKWVPLRILLSQFIIMRHLANLFRENGRILFLHGEPTSKPDALPKKGQEIGEMLATDVDLENQAITMYNEASVICAAEKDQKSKDLFEELLGEEEAHLHFFERIKNHIDKMGPAYIVTLTGKRQESP